MSDTARPSETQAIRWLMRAHIGTTDQPWCRVCRYGVVAKVICDRCGRALCAYMPRM